MVGYIYFLIEKPFYLHKTRLFVSSLYLKKGCYIQKYHKSFEPFGIAFYQVFEQSVMCLLATNERKICLLILTAGYARSSNFQGWAPWASWSQCSSTSGYGVQTRHRTCHSSSACPVGGNESKICMTAVHG